MEYLFLADNFIKSLLKDLSSFRVQLIIAAFGFNVYVIEKGKSDAVILSAVALLTTVYGAYFYSKHKQAEAEREAPKAD